MRADRLDFAVSRVAGVEVRYDRASMYIVARGTTYRVSVGPPIVLTSDGVAHEFQTRVEVVQFIKTQHTP